MTTYHEVAGTRVDRIAGLSDALFAIALTLTVLEVRVPMHARVMTETDLWSVIVPLAPRVLAYLLSFMTLGIFWIGDQTFLNQLSRSDRYLTWLHLGYLATIAIVPVSTGLLAEYITYRTAVILYWLNILMIGVLSLATVWYAKRAGLLNGRAGEEAVAALERRLVLGQFLYAFGAALALFQTYWSIGFIVIVQLWFAFGPQRLPIRRYHRPSVHQAAASMAPQSEEE
jgi:uncharacterized membrane protein